MRKSRIHASLIGVIVVVAPLSAGFAPFATSRPDPQTDSLSLVQVPPQQQSWDDHFQEIVRRLRVKLGDPTTTATSSLKSAVLALRTRFVLFGFPSDLSAADLNDMELDATELRDCAIADPKPPEGTDFGLIVYMHDLGNDLLKSIDLY